MKLLHKISLIIFLHGEIASGTGSKEPEPALQVHTKGIGR